VRQKDDALGLYVFFGALEVKIVPINEGYWTWSENTVAELADEVFRISRENSSLKKLSCTLRSRSVVSIGSDKEVSYFEALR